MAFGFTFAPTDANNTDRRNGSNPSQAPQGAIQTINYQLPRVAGAASLSPLVSQGGGGTPFSSAVLDSVLKTLLGADQASMMQAGGSIGGGQGGGQDNGAAFLQSLMGQSQGGAAPPRILPGGDGSQFAPPEGQKPNDPNSGRMDVPDTGFIDRTNPGPGNRAGNTAPTASVAGIGMGAAIPNFGGTAPGGGFGALMRNKEDGLYSSPTFT